MENQSSKNINKGKKLIILGFSTISILFLIYSRYQNPEVFTLMQLIPYKELPMVFTLHLLHHLEL